MPTKSVNFITPDLTDVHYQIFAGTAPVGATVTTGITEAQPGVYQANAPALVEGQRIVWSSASLPGVTPCEYYDPATDAYVAPPSAATIAAAVWNYLTSAATTAGSLGAYLLNRLGIVGSGSITVVAPVSVKGDVSLTRGDDYYAADGRALSWSSATWPVLTGAAVQFIVEGDVLSVAGSVVTAGTGTQTVQVELSSENTAALSGSSYSFGVVATLDDGHTITLVDRSLVTVSA